MYHNEAYDNSSLEGSPESEVPHDIGKAISDGSLSPQRHQSFITAVINAIKSAASTAKQTVKKPNAMSSMISNGEEESDATEMLDSETEPCLMMENVLEDVSMPDSHSHNMVSSANAMMLTSQMEPCTAMDKDEQSLYNLCQAIANRQQIEQQTTLMMMNPHLNVIDRTNSDDASIHESLADMPSISEYCTAQTVVDQVIDVDNLVTKLLKVLRIIQMDNDNCIQQLIVDKYVLWRCSWPSSTKIQIYYNHFRNKLQLNKEEMLEKLKDLELMNDKLRSNCDEASKELLTSTNDLANSRNELQRHRNEINVSLFDRRLSWSGVSKLYRTPHLPHISET